MIKFLTVLYIIGVSFIIPAQEVSVAVYYERKPQGVTITVQKGKYLVYNDFELVDTLNAGNNISIVEESEYLVYRNRSKAWATNTNIRIVNEGDAAFFINYTGSVEPARCYEGWLKLSLKNYSILVLNYVPLDSYVAAIVEEQGGGMASEEYFKTRAVMARTYTVLNYGKHSNEGFDLCDGSHCQNYKNKATNRVVINSSKKTANLVLVDKYKNLINPFYHLNSGGFTIPAEYVWDKEQTYLTSIVDEYASEGQNFSWKTLIPAAEWQTYLINKGLKSASSKLHKNLLIKQDKNRISEYKVGDDAIKLYTIMSDWGWKSSYFTMSLDKGVISVKGNGLGNGVGLSVESAKVMASKGYIYSDILNYFYKDIRIVNLNELNVYAQMIASNKKEKP